MVLRVAAVALIAAFMPGAAAFAEAPAMTAAQQRAAVRALDQRIGCAAFYRVTSDLLTGPRASARTRALAERYDAAGATLLRQADQLAGALGQDPTRLKSRFETAVTALAEEIDGQSVAYNRYAARLNPVCGRLVRR